MDNFFRKKYLQCCSIQKKCPIIAPEIQTGNIILKLNMTPNQKKRAVCSYENMSEELAAAFAEKYPKGYSDYFQDLVKYDKPDGTSFYAVTVEIPSAIYLVKIKVKTDDAEDIERWLDGEDGDDHDGNDGETIPDDNISQYSNGDDDSSDVE